jgi:uncharacterized protein YndB with AHSA1/START domain
MPSELDIVTTPEFEAPIALVFDVLTRSEHVSKWFAPFECEVTKCSIDLPVGGNYHIEPPTRTVETRLFEGWPDAEAVESVELSEADGATKVTTKLAFRDKAGRNDMTRPTARKTASTRWKTT